MVLRILNQLQLKTTFKKRKKKKNDVITPIHKHISRVLYVLLFYLCEKKTLILKTISTNIFWESIKTNMKKLCWQHLNSYKIFSVVFCY